MNQLDDTKRTHEIRIGMSLYWATTWATDGGYAYSAGGLEGAAATRAEALRAARKGLRAREASQLHVG